MSLVRDRKLRESQAEPLRHTIPLGALVRFSSQFLGPADQSFRVVRWMPDQGSGPQYRIQSEKTGQERVVTESQIASAEA